MRGNQILLLGFAVIAIGLFVLPNTMSMFVGQHHWFSVRTASDQYRLCERCHFAEVGEWEANTGAHSAYREYYKNLGGDPGCFCHQINTTRLSQWNVTGVDSKNYTFFNQTGSVNGSDPTTWRWRNTTTPHAATTVYCVDCHVNATAQLSNTKEAHKAFFEQARNVSLNPAVTNNTPCMACHTMVGLNVTMDRVHGGLIINATHSPDYNWTVNVSVNNTRTNASQYWCPNCTNLTGP
jgi:hypothetical protein